MGPPVLLSRSDALLALHPPSRQGFRLRYENIVNCFHLFTLIQAAFGERLPGGRAPNRFIVDMARCVTVAEEGNDEPWWRYQTVRPDEQDLVDISGEASVETISRVDGWQVILLSPSVEGAAFWDTSFFTPQLFAMPANVVLEEVLTTQEAAEWLARIGFPVGEATGAQGADRS